ncbi:MAG: hypothetical protein LKF36_11030 [Lactobacillus sp.]|jgi:hypothetical protein|nr:hypothetical protein [Lactobacillus sp.]
MFYAEDGAGEVIARAQEKYEAHFGYAFPLYNYLDITKDDEYDFSLAGAYRLQKFINERIEKNKPVRITDEYFDTLW